MRRRPPPSRAAAGQAPSARSPTPPRRRRAEEKGYGASPKADAPIVEARSRRRAAGDRSRSGDRVKASPLARRLAEQQGIDLAAVDGLGPQRPHRQGRSRRRQAGAPAASRDRCRARRSLAAPAPPPTPTPVAAPAAAPIPDIPHEIVKLSSMRKVIARRLTESKQQVPHIYLTVDIRLDPLLALRERAQQGRSRARGVKLSVNDMLIKALAVALIEVPSCNVMLRGRPARHLQRAPTSRSRCRSPAG